MYQGGGYSYDRYFPLGDVAAIRRHDTRTPIVTDGWSFLNETVAMEEAELSAMVLPTQPATNLSQLPSPPLPLTTTHQQQQEQPLQSSLPQPRPEPRQQSKQPQQPPPQYKASNEPIKGAASSSSSSSTPAATTGTAAITTAAATSGSTTTDATYVLRIHEMLEDAEKEGHTDIVSWQPHGRAFKVHKEAEFVEKIMPRYFSCKVLYTLLFDGKF